VFFAYPFSRKRQGNNYFGVPLIFSGKENRLDAKIFLVARVKNFLFDPVRVQFGPSFPKASEGCSASSIIFA